MQSQTPSHRKKITVLKYLCRTCSKCILVCPSEAISYENDNKAFIDLDLCTTCGACLHVCPEYAIRSS
ncbi:ATP-binding protein [Sporomusa sp.]|uniref:ATP-binding protein n=1 Tax=Sporomusa sp. TaxID=2078658 RepID=UPI0039C9A0AD